MKLLIILSLVFSVSSFAQARLTLEQQTQLVEGIAKSERRDLWRTGHADVSSYVEKMSKMSLDTIMAENGNTQEPLDEAQISSLYKCLHSSKNCSLFLVSITASLYGGFGDERLWVLLNPSTGKSETISQFVYGE